ncbi:MAG: sensor domain-containing protein [Pseudomonadota bacterium]
MFEKIAALTPGAFYRFQVSPDGKSRFTHLGLGIEDFTGVSRDRIIENENALFDLIPRSYEAEMQQLIQESYQNLSEFCFVFPVIKASGEKLWLEARSYPERQQNGVLVWTGFVYDVTRRENANNELREYSKTANQILDNILDAIFTTDEDGVILFANSAAQKLLDFSQEQLLGKNISSIMPTHHQAQHDNYIQRYIKTGDAQIIGSMLNVEVVDRHHQEIPVELRICEYFQEGQRRFMGTLRDLRPNIERQQELQSLRDSDTMTGMLNRNALLVELGILVDNYPVTQSEKHALICLDIDDFTLINEGFGVDAGDKVLTQVGGRLASLSHVTAARIQEDEFAVLIKNIADKQQLLNQFNQIKQAVEQVILLEEERISFSISAGGCIIDSAESNPLEILHNTQSALGMSKARSRGELTIYEPKIGNNYRLSAQIDQKLKSPELLSELFLMYQPQYQAGGQLIGYEALLRWKSGTDMIGPDEFIPIAEHNGTILKIGSWLLDQACDFIEWMSARPDHESVRLSINISPLQFRQAQFVDEILDKLRQRKIDPKCLHLELTEQLLVDSTEDVSAKMAALNMAGITFSLDDFGTGYCSMRYLAELPLSELKIDKSFIQGLERTSSNYQIVEAILLLSYGLGLTVIAEGVETNSELTTLQAMGCVYYQGYYFSRPQRLEDLENL